MAISARLEVRVLDFHTTREIAMNKLFLLATLALMGVMATSSAYAAPKTYQVTGPVIELTSDKIVVEKGKEKWEILRGTAAIPDTVKVGSKVTVQYLMTADSVVSKDAPAKPASAKPATVKPAAKK
jgi:hypothetical protein